MITVEQLRAARGFFNMGQREFAQECGFGKTTLINIESGMRMTPDIESKIVAFCRKNGLLFVDGGIKPKRK
ncbi:HTH-type transcriptional regulator protein [Rhizobium phage RHph_N28_1]|nr:HTH-type transcriptional regulator protein [Rhizobium phage RHph_N28_1]QIG74051.1 HTH-type transcriptional regulator protein [Rhizobium phage RHph_N42]QIG74660.1 HTH-type transcriptional regulator protein [Rhizobium phage RHph_I42]QXV73711.1 HTH-type transcriptional regulator protein [Rhizobium phage RHph_N46]